MSNRWCVVSLCALVGCGGASDAQIEALQTRVEQLETQLSELTAASKSDGKSTSEITARRLVIVDENGVASASLSTEGLKMWREGDEFAKCVLSARSPLIGLTIRDTGRSIDLTLSSDEQERATLLLTAGQTSGLIQANSETARMDLRNKSAQSEMNVFRNRSVLSIEGDGGNSAFTLKAQSGRPQILTLPVE